MKKYLALALSMMLVLGAMAMAAPQDPGKGKAKDKMAGEKKDKPAPGKKAGGTASGTVTAKTDTELTVKGKTDSWTFGWDKTTKMSGDIKEGSMVTVKYTEKDGKKWATSVTAKPAGKAAGTPKKGGKDKKPAM